MDISGNRDEVEKDEVMISRKPKLDVRLTDLRVALGPQLRIVYPLILNFSVLGELEFNVPTHPKWIRTQGTVTFDNSDVNLVATHVLFTYFTKTMLAFVT